jgi:DNA-directed RNA polymerase specialized sigma24 family protein
MVFILRDLQDLSIEETSKILRMSNASVKSNLFHARKFLRERIEQLEKAGL